MSRLPPEHVTAARAPSPRGLPPSARPHASHRPGAPAQLKAKGASSDGVAAAPGLTGLPEGLQAGLEALSGFAMDDVRVHRNSAEPARLGALAFARGSEIHLGPGQERHLPHEAWHVVQQKQGRVAPGICMKGAATINADPALEREADRMGDRASYAGLAPDVRQSSSRNVSSAQPRGGLVVQLNGDGLTDVAKDIISGARDVRELAGRLPEDQMQIVEQCVRILRQMEDVERAIEPIVRARAAAAEAEAAAVPAMSLEEFLAADDGGDNAAVAEPEANAEAVPAMALENFRAADDGAGNVEEFGELVDQLDDQAIRDRLGEAYREAALRAAPILQQRLQSGLIPANRVRESSVVRSADETEAAVISVNVLPRTSGDPGRLKNTANFAAMNAAGGALPIAIEQYGDAGEPDLNALSLRAFNSAVLIIDPEKLSEADKHRVMQSSTNGGETGLERVPPRAIIAVIAPVSLRAQLRAEYIGRYNIQFVGAQEEAVPHMVFGIVDILAPDYRSGVKLILQRFPQKVLVTHTTRLGGVAPPHQPAFGSNSRVSTYGLGGSVGSSGFA